MKLFRVFLSNLILYVGLTVNFVMMGDYFVQKSIEKALKIDKIEQDSLTSTCVDDVFYILKACIQKGSATGDPDCLSALINSAGRTLELEFMNVLQKRLSTAYLSSNSADSAKEPNKIQFFTALNNIDVSCHYISKLVSDVEADLPYSFQHCSDMDKEKIKSCLHSIREYSATFSSILKTWLDNFFNAAIKTKMRTMMASLSIDLSYILDEVQFDELETQQPFLKKFQKSFSNLLSAFQNRLTSHNNTVLIGFMIDHFVKEWERILMGMQFNFLGANRLGIYYSFCNIFRIRRAWYIFTGCSEPVGIS